MAEFIGIDGNEKIQATSWPQLYRARLKELKQEGEVVSTQIGRV